MPSKPGNNALFVPGKTQENQTSFRTQERQMLRDSTPHRLHYFRNAVQSIPNNALTTVLFDTADATISSRLSDPQGLYNPTTGQWKCPATAEFLIAASITYNLAVGYATSQNTFIEVDVNGVLRRRGMQITHAAGGTVTPTLIVSPGPIPLHIGDLVTISVFQQTGAAQNTWQDTATANRPAFNRFDIIFHAQLSG